MHTTRTDARTFHPAGSGLANAAPSSTDSQKPRRGAAPRQRWRTAVVLAAVTASSAACVAAPGAAGRSYSDQLPGRLDAFPVIGSVEYSNDYGDSRSGGRSHQGNDILADTGQTIVAVEAGTLIDVSYTSMSGNRIWLVTDSGEAYFYAHLDEFAPGIEEGDRVRAGQALGTVGATGNAAGGPSHLHFEIHPGGRGASATNPYSSLRDAEARAVVVP